MGIGMVSVGVGISKIRGLRNYISPTVLLDLYICWIYAAEYKPITSVYKSLICM